MTIRLVAVFPLGAAGSASAAATRRFTSACTPRVLGTVATNVPVGSRGNIVRQRSGNCARRSRLMMPSLPMSAVTSAGVAESPVIAGSWRSGTSPTRAPLVDRLTTR
jgi:hypothetical protein